MTWDTQWDMLPRETQVAVVQERRGVEIQRDDLQAQLTDATAQLADHATRLQALQAAEVVYQQQLADHEDLQRRYTDDAATHLATALALTQAVQRVGELLAWQEQVAPILAAVADASIFGGGVLPEGADKWIDQARGAK